jgi:hypothetical protein
MEHPGSENGLLRYSLPDSRFLVGRRTYGECGMAATNAGQ